MKSLFFALIMLLFSLSCSKKSDPNPAAIVPTNCELVSESAPGETINISYNTAGLADTIKANIASQSARSVVLYDAQNHITDIYDQNQHQVFQTGVNGKPTTVTTFLRKKSGADSSQFNITTFTWAADTLIQKMTLDSYDYYRYEYDNQNNLVRVYTSSGGTEYLYQRFSKYDTKNSPLRNFPFVLDEFFGSPPYLITKYDPVVKKHNYGVATTFDYSHDSTTVNYTPTYNAQGFPLTLGAGSYGYKCN